MRTPLLVAASLLLAAIPLAATPSLAEDAPPILRAGLVDEPKTWNPISPLADDPATADLLLRTYDRPVRPSPYGAPGPVQRAYIAKGVDADEDGTFEPSEYDVFLETGTTTPLLVTVYYDFNGVRWHDNASMDPWDFLFSYHVAAMDPLARPDIVALFPAATYEDGGRQLNVSLADADSGTPGYQKGWEGEASMPGDPDLRVAVEFRLREPFVLFAEKMLAPLLLPIHVWSGANGGHADFGCAIYVPPAVAADRAIPCATTNPVKWGRGVPSTATDVEPFDADLARAWAPSPAEVIGSGPFVAHSWTAGVGGAMDRFDGYYVGETYDPRLGTRLHRPYIGGIAFTVYASGTLAVFALLGGEIDVVYAPIGPEFVPDLLKDPGIGIESNTTPGFARLVYNLRKAPWGYESGDPARDVGQWLRQAVSHLVDLPGAWDCWFLPDPCRIVEFVHPANTFWFNPNIPKPAFDPAMAAIILDFPEAAAAGIGPDPPGACAEATPDGCRVLPGIGNASFDLLPPPSAVDPLLASVAAMLAANMRGVGLNAAADPTPPADRVAARNARTFDTYVEWWDIRTVDPDYLFGAFDSSNRDGANHGGLANATIDVLLEDSRRELNRSLRRERMHQVQFELAGLRPAEPLYWRTNIQGFRSDRFINWTVEYGTIWNECSLFGIRPPKVQEEIRVSVSAPSALRSGDAGAVAVAVAKPDGVALSGAAVTLEATAGNLTVGLERGPTVNATADAAGRVAAWFEAPNATDVARVLILAQASHPDFEDPGLGMAVVTVYPEDVSFLSITVELPLGDIARPGATLPMRVAVVDPMQVPVPDAQVTVETSDAAALWAEPSAGTAAELASVVLRTDPAIENETEVRVVVRATKPFHADGEQSVSIAILPLEPATYRCPTGEIVADLADCPEVVEPFPTALVAGLAAAIGLAVVAAVLVVRRRRSSPRKP